jgi:thiamine biosynthesis protein ThiS
MKTLKINGQEQNFEDKMPQTLAELLETLNVKAETVVAEIDGSIIEQKDFASTKIKPSQSIELVRFVPGG